MEEGRAHNYVTTQITAESGKHVEEKQTMTSFRFEARKIIFVRGGTVYGNFQQQSCLTKLQ